MSNVVRIGNAHGFWGDRLDAAAEMLAREPDLDFLTLDFLAEVSMSILALQRSRDPDAGWPRDVVEVVRSLAPYWREGGRCRFITNAGGLNPVACARACQQALTEAGCPDLCIVAITGDDVLDLLRGDAEDAPLLRNMDTGESLARMRECGDGSGQSPNLQGSLARDRLVTANAYIGAEAVARALELGADLVIAGRVADPSLTVGACAQAFGWSWSDWDRLAGATVAGHLIECGAQVTGGISDGWLELPDLVDIGFPIVEVAADGSFIVTKPQGTGGRVCEQTVKEQLVYEIGDPDNYLSPDVTVSFLEVCVEDLGADRVAVSGARGRPRSPTYKVSATYQDGYRAQGQLTVFGHDAVAKARRAGEVLLERLHRQGARFRESLIECLGTGACHPHSVNAELSKSLTETVLRVSVADDSREAVTRFARELTSLITGGPPGTTGYAEGRPQVHPLFRFWPCLIERDRVVPQCEVISESPGRAGVRQPPNRARDVRELTPSGSVRSEMPTPALGERRLRDIAYARSGDKGLNSNIGVVARCPEFYAELCRELTTERVAAHFGILNVNRVERFELPQLGAMNFVLRGVLENSLRIDAQGKAFGQALLELRL